MLRRLFRNAYFSFFRRSLVHDKGRSALAEAVQGLCRGENAFGWLSIAQPPYRDLGAAHAASGGHLRDDAVFVTGRFRSGSTLLWNVFRQCADLTSYYEPFNERRWFRADCRGERIDTTHLGVEEYWREYAELDELDQYYDASWIRRHLYMDASSWQPRMKRYIELLMERAHGRPVLQFNRVDFRLPWLRATFPNAKIVHIFRHPRDQWCSTFLKGPVFSPYGKTRDYGAFDGFYLLTWANDLKYTFPFLDPELAEHPYELFYYLWRLSYAFGREFADYSVQFENLVTNPDVEIRQLFQSLRISETYCENAASVVKPPLIGRWPDYAADRWFSFYEGRCEDNLADFGSRSQNASPTRHAHVSNGQRASQTADLASPSSV
jgi:hypothetical protein